MYPVPFTGEMAAPGDALGLLGFLVIAVSFWFIAHDRNKEKKP